MANERRIAALMQMGTGMGHFLRAFEEYMGQVTDEEQLGQLMEVHSSIRSATLRMENLLTKYNLDGSLADPSTVHHMPKGKH